MLVLPHILELAQVAQHHILALLQDLLLELVPLDLIGQHYSLVLVLAAPPVPQKHS